MLEPVTLAPLRCGKLGLLLGQIAVISFMRSLLILHLGLASFCSAQTYFPKISFDQQANVNEIHVRSYSEALKAMDERPLVPLQRGATESYRFTWLRTFDRPVALRIDVTKNGTARFFLKVTDGKGGYEPGKLVREEAWEIGSEALKTFRQIFERASFFNQATGDEQIGLDGSTWLIEANVKGRYHAVSRWSPRTGTIRAIGTALLDMAVADFAPLY